MTFEPGRSDDRPDVLITLDDLAAAETAIRRLERVVATRLSVEASSLYLALEAAVLRGAANLGGAKVLGVATVGYIDGWPTTLWRTDQGYRIQAGCHTFTLDEAVAHYANRAERRGLYYLATEAWRVIARLQGWEQEVVS